MFEELDVAVAGLTKLGLFFGPQRGIVTDNKDPQRRGRIKARVPTVHDETPDVWIDPMFDGASNQQGKFHVPPVDAAVWVEFENGQPERPARYSGGWYGSDKVGDMPAEFTPDPVTNEPLRSGIVTRAGHTLVFNDTPGQETVRITWHKPASGDASLGDPTAAADRTTGDTSFLSFLPDGSVQITNKDGAQIGLDAENKQIIAIAPNGTLMSLGAEGAKLMDKSGRVLSLTPGGTQIVDPGQVTVQAQTVVIQAGTVFLGPQANASALLGEATLEYLRGHQHPTGVGLSGPPITPPPTTLLSKSVKLT